MVFLRKKMGDQTFEKSGLRFWRKLAHTGFASPRCRVVNFSMR
jgi:hypothetical protein